MISKTAFIIIAVVLGLGGATSLIATNSAQAHRGYGSIGSYGNNYNDNGNGDYGPYSNDNWNNNGGWHPHHRHFHDFNNNDFNQRDVRINQPIDNSGDINRANADSAAKLNCDTKTICQGVNTNVIGNGNTVIVNTNAAGQQDGGGPY